MTAVDVKCFKVLRSLRFDETQDPEIVLNGRVKTIGLKSQYLINVFYQKAISKLGKKVSPTFRPCGASSL